MMVKTRIKKRPQTWTWLRLEKFLSRVGGSVFYSSKRSSTTVIETPKEHIEKLRKWGFDLEEA